MKIILKNILKSIHSTVIVNVFAMACLLLVGCAGKDADPFAHYRHQSSAQIFHSAEMAAAKRRYKAAVKAFEALDALYPFSPYSRQGQLDIIYVYYKSGDDASAITAADRYIRLYPRGPHVDYAYYMKGLISYQQGFSWLQKIAGSDPSSRSLANKEQAFLAFSDLVRYFPHSQYKQDALLHMAYIRNLIARHNVAVASFYYKRKAYVAAINRASFVVKHFNRSPAIEPALVILVKSYRALGLTEMMHATQAVLAVNFPQNKAIKITHPHKATYLVYPHKATHAVVAT